MNIVGLEHIDEPFNWGIAMSLMGKGYKVTDPSTPVDDYLYWSKEENCYKRVFNTEEEVITFSPLERQRTNYNLVH
jgi:hypothetical protein